MVYLKHILTTSFGPHVDVYFCATATYHRQWRSADFYAMIFAKLARHPQGIAQFTWE